MGGKTSTSTSSVAIPPEVLARYNAVNARAEDVSQQPFQQYGGQFVAPLTPTQQAGLINTSTAAGAAQPYYGAATGLSLAGAMPVSPGGLQTGRYMNPFTQAVAAPTYQALRQQQGQELAQQQSTAIRSGAAFGERSGLERANLMRQQGLGTAQALAPIFQQGYGQALQTAQQQQGVQLGAEQANRQALQQAATQIAGLGAGAQQAALQGASAQMQAGAQEQQTQQADLTARYQQFLQERGYPFQVAQFLANIAMGTGALSGSTTTTTQPAGFFSDEREKTNIKPLGKGLYAYDYKDDVERARKTGEPMPPKRVGPMAQDIEKEDPGLVVNVKGHKVVRNPDSMGGVVAEPGAFDRGGYLGGGGIDADDQRGVMKSVGEPVGVYGTGTSLGKGLVPTGGYVPQANIYVPRLVTASPVGAAQPAGLAQVASAGKGFADLYQAGKGLKSDLMPSDVEKADRMKREEEAQKYLSAKKSAHGGLIIDRHHYDGGGDVDFADNNDPNEDRARVPTSGFPKDVLAAGSKAASLATSKGGGGGGGPGSGLSQLGDAAKSISNIAGLFGEEGALSGVGDFVGSFFAHGGNVHGLDVRKAYAEGSDVEPVEAEAPQYKIQPQKKEEMEPHWQGFIKDIYSREGGVDKEGRPRYNIRQGGQETFDIEKGHPGLKPARGGESSASGAGQFINATWNRVTGGAPMTEGYQDAATKALAIDDYRRRTGRDLDADLREKGFTPEIRSALAPTWTSLYGKGDVPARGAQEAQYRAEPESGLSMKNIGDTVTSDKFLVPFLSFVGSTLASQRPTLGGALGEGIVGGVGGYQQNRQIQAQLAKGVMDLVKERFSRSQDEAGNTIWFDKYTGNKVSSPQLQKTVAEIYKARGLDPAEYGINASAISALPAISAAAAAPAGAATTTTGPAKAEGAPAAKPTEGAAKSWMETPPDQVNLLGKAPSQVEDYVKRWAGDFGLTGARDPAKLQAEIDRDRNRAKSLAATGDEKEMTEAQSLRLSADEKQKRLDSYIKEAAALQVGINAENAKAETQSIGQRNEEMDRRQAAYETERARLTRLADIYSKWGPGRGSQIKADLESWFKDTIGYVPDVLKGNTPNYDEALKIALGMSFGMVGDNNLSRAPKAALERAVQTVPNPSLDPGATYALIGRQLGEMDYLMAKDKAWVESGRNVRPGVFEMQYRDKNPNAYKESIRNAFGQIPKGEKVGRETLDNIRKSYGDFTPKLPAGVEVRRSTEQPSAPAAPQAPEALRGMSGLQYNPARNQYRDAQGNIYDATGKRVQ